MTVELLQEDGQTWRGSCEFTCWRNHQKAGSWTVIL